jgi:hypothetical protein
MTETEIEITPERTYTGRRFTFKDGVWKIYVDDGSEETIPVIESPPIHILADKD